MALEPGGVRAPAHDRDRRRRADRRRARGRRRGARAARAGARLPRDRPAQTRVILVEAGPRLLANFPEPLSRYTPRRSRRLGVEVRLGRAVTHCDAEGVRLGEEAIPRRARSSGQRACARRLPRAGSASRPTARDAMPVGPDLRAPGLDDIYVDRRHGAGAESGRRAAARDCAGREAAGCLRRARDRGAHRGQGGAAAISFIATAGCCATIGRKAAVIAYKRLRLKRLARLVALGRGARVLPREPAQPAHRRHAVAVVLPCLRARRAPDHRSGSRTGGPERQPRASLPAGANA